GRDVLPALPVSCRHVHEAVVAARPDEPLLLRRLGDREDGAEGFDAGVVAGDRAAGPLLLRLVVAGEVGTDHVPVLAGVARAEDHLRAVVDDLRVEWRAADRRGPLEAVLHLFAALARRILWPRGDFARLAGAIVVAREDAEVFAGVDDVRIAGIGVDVARLAAADVVPVGEMDAAGEAVARPLRRAEILHRAGDVVRPPHVDRDVVELRNRQRRRVPALAAVARDVHPAVVADDAPAGIGGIEP